MRRTLVALALLAMILLHSNPLRAEWLSNLGLMSVLHTPLCDPQWYVCFSHPAYYPPQEWSGNQAALNWARDQLLLAARLNPSANNPWAHLAELYYAVGDLETASYWLNKLPGPEQTHAVDMLEPRAFIFSLRSRLYEKNGDDDAAIAAAQRGLQVAAFHIPPELERTEVQRISDLYGTLILNARGRQAADLVYAAAFYAACAADWAATWDRAGNGLLSEHSLAANQQAMLSRLLAWRAHLQGNFESETQWLTQAGSLAWDQWTLGDPYLWIGYQLEASDSFACARGAQQIYTWYSQEHPASAQGFYLQGLLFLDRSDFGGAERSFSAGYQRDPAHVDSVRGLALAYELEEQPLSAIEWYHRAIAIWPTNGEYHARLARVLHRMGRDNEAEEQFDISLGLAPKDDTLLVWAGYFYLDKGRPDRAENLLHAAVAINPDNITARQGLDRLNSLQRSR